MAKDIVKLLFRPGIHIILVFDLKHCSKGNPICGALNRGWMGKSTVFCQYLAVSWKRYKVRMWLL